MNKKMQKGIKMMVEMEQELCDLDFENDEMI